MTKHGLMEETFKTLMEVTGGTFDLYITILDSVEVLLNFLFIKESGGGGCLKFSTENVNQNNCFQH